MRTFAVAVIVSCSFAASSATGDPAKSQHSTNALPTVKLEASPTGKAKFRIGAGYTYAHLENVDFLFEGFYQTTTNEGAAKLLSFSEEKTTTPDWQLGGAFTAFVLHPAIALDDEMQRRDLAEFRKCLKKCSLALLAATSPDKPFCSAADVVRIALNLASLDPDVLTAADVYRLRDNEPFDVPAASFCPDGAKAISEADISWRDAVGVVPKYTASFGILAGRTNFEYLEPSGDAPKLLLPKERRSSSVAGSGTFIYATDDLLTVQLDVRLQSKATPTSKKAKWCIPAGTVSDGGVEAPGETCSERSIGSPKRSRFAEVAAYVGFISASRSTRVNAGVFYAREPVTDGPDRRTYGLRFPMTLSTDILPGAGIYKGVLRLTPSLAFVETSGSEDNIDSQFLLVLEVFTSRSLLGSVIDAL